MAIEPGFRFIRPKEVDKILGISRAKREAMVREGMLPKPYSLGRRAVGFRSDEIEAVLLNFPRKESAYAHSGRRRNDRVIVMKRTKWPNGGKRKL
jgi:predicted DNA-binding transcriptional regulator AlpA